MRVQFRSLFIVPLAMALLVAGPRGAQAQDQPWKFIAFGDCLTFAPEEPVNTQIVRELALEVVRQRAAFLLFLGDFSLYGTAEGLAIWTNAMSPVFEAGIPIYPAIGNHDQSTLAAISNVFGAWLPLNGPEGELGSTYALSYRNALFLVLNEFAPGNEYRVNQAWVDAVLATNSLPHVFAAGHMPAFKVLHTDCLNYFPANRDLFWNSLSNAGARIYFSGHDHFYDHSRLDDGDGNQTNDLHQVIAGTGGAPLYPDNPYDGINGVWTPARAAHEPQHGYMAVEIAGHAVSCTWFRRDGTNLFSAAPDVFSYTVTPRPVLRHHWDTSRLALSWSGSAILQCSPDPAGPFTNVPGASSSFIVPNLDPPRLFYRLALP